MLKCEICASVVTVWFVALCCIRTFVKPHTKAFVLVYTEHSTLSMAECCACINTHRDRERERERESGAVEKPTVTPKAQATCYTAVVDKLPQHAGRRGQVKQNYSMYCINTFQLVEFVKITFQNSVLTPLKMHCTSV